MNKIIQDYKWLIYSVLAALCWGCWGVLSKMISMDVNPFVNQLLFTLGMSCTLPFVLVKCRKKDVSLKSFLWGMAVAFLAISGNICVYQSFRLGGMAAVVIPFTNLYPLITIIFAIVVFRERLNWKNYIGMAMVIPAILLLSGQMQFLKSINLFSDNFNGITWFIYASLALLLFGLFSASQKTTTTYLSAEWSFISFIATSLVLSVAFICFHLVDFKFQSSFFWTGTLAGLMDGLGVLAIYAAYRAQGKASQVSPIASSLQQVFTVLMAMLILSENITIWALSGVALAVVGSWLLTIKT